MFHSTWRYAAIVLALAVVCQFTDLRLPFAQADETAGKKEAASNKEAEPVPGSMSLEELIKANDFAFSKQKSGIYEIIAEPGADSLVVFAGETTAFTDRQDKEHKIVALWTTVMKVSPEFAAKPPVAFLMALNSFNNKYDPGKVALNPKTGEVTYQSSFWMEAATPHTLHDELVTAFVRRPTMKKELQPYVGEE